jgi:hypothetical protein
MNQLHLKVVPTTGPTQYFRSALTGTILTFGDALNLMDLQDRSAAGVADLDEEFEPVHVHLLGVKLAAPGAVLLGNFRVYASTDTGLGVDLLPTMQAYLAAEDHAYDSGAEPTAELTTRVDAHGRVLQHPRVVCRNGGPEPEPADTEEGLLEALELVYGQYLDGRPRGTRVTLPDDEAQFLRKRAARTRGWRIKPVDFQAGRPGAGYRMDRGSNWYYLEPLRD